MLLLRLRCATLVSVSYSNYWISIDYQLIETFFNYSKAINWQEFWNFFKWQGMEFFLWFLFVLLVNDIVYAWILFWNFHLINVQLSCYFVWTGIHPTKKSESDLLFRNHLTVMPCPLWDTYRDNIGVYNLYGFNTRLQMGIK